MKISEKLKILPFGEPGWFSLNGIKLWQDLCDLKDIPEYHSGTGLRIKKAVKKFIYLYEVELRGFLNAKHIPNDDEFEILEEMLQQVKTEFDRLSITPEMVDQSNSATPHPNNINLDNLRRIN